jgi:hypothetical protein
MLMTDMVIFILKHLINLKQGLAEEITRHKDVIESAQLQIKATKL